MEYKTASTLSKSGVNVVVAPPIVEQYGLSSYKYLNLFIAKILFTKENYKDLILVLNSPKDRDVA